MINDTLINSFFARYADSAVSPSLFFAPGRVNLIGEHTDYNGGYVLPCALTFGTYLAIRRTNDSLVKFSTTNFDFSVSIPLHALSTKIDGQWVNYPLGVINQFIKRGLEIGGMELLFSGNIPNGAGLSSSASIELVTAVALNDLFQFNLDKWELVKLSQKAENEFVGMNCGIMDVHNVRKILSVTSLSRVVSTISCKGVARNIPARGARTKSNTIPPRSIKTQCIISFLYIFTGFAF